MAREEREEELFRLLKRAFASQRRAIMRQVRDGKVYLDEQFWLRERNAMSALLQQEIQSIMIEGAERAFNDFFNIKQGELFGDIVRAASERVQSLTLEIIGPILDNTRAFVLDELYAYITNPEMTYPMLEERLTQMLGPTRARLIGTTEVTRAYAEGTIIVKREIEAEGFELVRIWRTRRDDRVCPICGPLHGKPEDEWGGVSLPAHPNCRCADSLELVA